MQVSDESNENAQYVNKFIREVSDTRPKIPNDIISFREEDSMLKYIESLWHNIEINYPDNFKYLGSEFVNNFNIGSTKEEKDDTKKNKKKKDGKFISETYIKTLRMKFRLSIADECRDVTSDIYIPILVEGRYTIEGMPFVAPFQLEDAVFNVIHRNTRVLIKSLIREVGLIHNTDVVHIVDIDDVEYPCTIYDMKLGYNMKPFMLYFLSEMGLSKTMKFFLDELANPEYVDVVSVVKENNVKLYFKLGGMYICVDKAMFINNLKFRNVIANIWHCLNKHNHHRDFDDTKFWIGVLGKLTTNTKPFDRGYADLVLFRTSFDKHLKENLSTYINIEIETIFELMRWVFNNFKRLVSKSFPYTQRKRLTLAEYLVSPMIAVSKTKYWRFCNSKAKGRDMRALMDVVRVKPTIILDAMTGRLKCKGNVSNIVRYNEEYNDMFNSQMSVIRPIFSKKRQSLSEEADGLEPGEIGILDPFATSAGRPGSSNILTAQIRLDPKTKKLLSNDE